MTLRTGAARFITLLCLWLAALMAIGAVTVARADSSCESFTNPYAFNEHAIFPFSFVSDCESPNPPGITPKGTCPPPQR
ncbi:unnamed protein product [Miscanthus lutarioriparius]|uniref:Uncharacterized protein n=1 Tax=Miscanthus lutarioriparius TaxID=422564 RepID=A0A811PXV3_9POAL|nr:unnamed protein product [Miscanthus lutarioriparius]